MGHVIKRLSCTTIFWYDISFQSLWRCSFVEDGCHILIFESLKDAAFLVQNLLKKIGSYWQWRTPENSTTIYRKVRWGRSRFSNLLPSTLSETPASSLQPIGCRDYPNISNQQPADSRFRRVSEAPGQEATNMRPGWPSEREGKGGLPGCLVTFSAAS